MNTYIVASSKPWHYAEFKKQCQSEPDLWHYVATPKELEGVLLSLVPRYIFFLHWNWKVPSLIWKSHECVCFHMTDVPYGRGGSPLQNLILEGKADTVLTALRIIDEMDAGPVYTKLPLSLAGRAEEIYLRAGSLSWEIIRWMLREEPSPIPQEGEVTYFSRRNPEQSRLPKDVTLEDIFNHIRMLDAPTYPAAFMEYGGVKMEFSHAEMSENVVRAQVTFRRCNSVDSMRVIDEQ